MNGDSKGKKLIFNSLLFLFGNAGAKLLMLIIVPLYTYYVEVEQMGQYDVVQAYVNLFYPFAGLAIYEGIYRWLLDEKADRQQVLRNGLSMTVKAMLCFDLVVFAVLYGLRYVYWFEFIILLDTTCLYITVQWITRGLHNNKLYVVQGFVFSFTLLLTTIVLVVCLGLQAKGLMWAVILTHIVTITFLLLKQGLGVDIFRQGTRDKELMQALFKYSVMLVPNTAAWWVVTASNRLLINWRLGDAANGIYAIALYFPSFVTMLSWIFYLAWQEQAISEYGSADRDAYYTKVFDHYMPLMLSGIIVLMPVSKFIITNMMATTYETAKDYIGILFISAAFSAFSSFFGTGYLSSKKTGGAFTTTILGAVTNLLLCLVLIEKIGLMAAAVGVMAGNGSIWAARIIQTRKYFSIKVNFVQFLYLLALDAVAIFLVDHADLTELVVLQLFFIAGFLFINRAMVFKVWELCIERRAIL